MKNIILIIFVAIAFIACESKEEKEFIRLVSSSQQYTLRYNGYYDSYYYLGSDIMYKRKRDIPISKFEGYYFNDKGDICYKDEGIKFTLHKMLVGKEIYSYGYRYMYGAIYKKSKNNNDTNKFVFVYAFYYEWEHGVPVCMMYVDSDDYTPPIVEGEFFRFGEIDKYYRIATLTQSAKWEEERDREVNKKYQKPINLD